MIQVDIKSSIKFNFEPYVEDIEKMFLRILKMEKIKHDNRTIVLDLSFVGEKKILSLNKEYRYKDYVTDVLSFPVDHPKESIMPIVLLGDVYVCVEKARKQAVDYNHSFQREIFFLICHGILHLLGYDHILEEDEAKMRVAQRKIMRKMKIRR